MQLLIQHIFTQIIDFDFYFLKGSVISLEKVDWESKDTFCLVSTVFGQKFTRNAKNGVKCLKLI